MTIAHQTIPVSLGDRSYDIHVGQGLIQQASALAAPLIENKRAIIISDTNIERAGHIDTVCLQLQSAGIDMERIVLPAGEGTKSFQQLERLMNRLLDFKPDRKTVLIALGGGVIGDLTGFAASILLRGVPFIQIPTTLLSMVDSSVGGKTGINTSHGKNLIGSFYQPSLVLADVDVLNTLPQREILAGYAEVVKYGLLGDATFFDELDTYVHRNGSAFDAAFLTRMITKSCQAKAEIVAQDEREGSVRALLNLGHTFGHALEAHTGYGNTLLHGEAVAIGMVLAFRFSEFMGLCSREDSKRVRTHIAHVGLPASVAALEHMPTAEDLVASMYQDKKADRGTLVFVLVKAIGEAYVEKSIDVERLTEFLHMMVDD